MPYFITNGKAPLLMETVPVLKTTYYYGNAVRDNVYTYMRCYAYNGSMFCNFTSFDENPPEHVRLSLSLTHIDSDDILVCTCGKTAQISALLQKSTNEQLSFTNYIKSEPVITGNDEQGFYWSINFEITAKAFKLAFNKKVETKDIYIGNFFIHSLNEDAFGSAFEASESTKQLWLNKGESFFVVPY